MKIEQFFKEWISTRPNLKAEFHDAGIEAMAFAEAYHKKQLALCNVSCSLPSKEDVYTEIKRLTELYYNDDNVRKSAFGLGFSAGVNFINKDILK